MRPGLTFIELIVALSIIVIISTLAVVALNSARESSRTMACASNQRQLGVAIMGYESAFRVLPINVYEEEDILGFVIPVENHSAHTRLLPFLDGASTVSPISFGLTINVGKEWEMDTPPVLRCPSESKSTSRSFNYCYSIGPRELPSSFMPLGRSEKAGAFGTTYKPISNGQTSGLSNLIFVSERSVGSRSALKKNYFDWEMVDFDQGNGKRDWYSIFFYGETLSTDFTPNQWTQACATTLARRPQWAVATGGMWTMGADAYFNEIMSPNSQIPDCGMRMYPMAGCRSARSEHKSHVNVLFGDGSVRRIENGIDLESWRELAAVEKQAPVAVVP